jgi:hypothetical protein
VTSGVAPVFLLLISQVSTFKAGKVIHIHTARLALMSDPAFFDFAIF